MPRRATRERDLTSPHPPGRGDLGAERPSGLNALKVDKFSDGRRALPHLLFLRGDAITGFVPAHSQRGVGVPVRLYTRRRVRTSPFAALSSESKIETSNQNGGRN